MILFMAASFWIAIDRWHLPVTSVLVSIALMGRTLGSLGKIQQQLQSVYAEVRVPRYRRNFTLSRELDGSRIEANLKDGVLNLRIPKQEHAKPRRVEVRAG